jgi:hypothetical protein
MILPHNFVQFLQHDSAYNRKSLLALITLGKTTQVETGWMVCVVTLKEAKGSRLAVAVKVQ